MACVFIFGGEGEEKGKQSGVFALDGLNGHGALQTLLLQLAFHFVGLGDVAVEGMGVGLTAAAAIEFGKAVPTLLFCIYITQFKCIAHIRIYNTVIYISQAKLFFTHELMTRIQIAPRCNR